MRPTLLIIALLLTLTACAQPEPTIDVRVCDEENNITCTGPATPEMKLTMFSVGQGQSVLIQIPQDNPGNPLNAYESNILYDAGPKIRDHDLPGTIDQLIISNPDKDHLAGAAWVLDTKQVQRFIEPYVLPCETKTCILVREKVFAEPGIEITHKFAGSRIYKADTPRVGWKTCTDGTNNSTIGTLVNPFTPIIEYLNPDPLEPFNNDNDNSIVLLVTYGNTTILLMGDCEKACEDRLVENLYPRNVDVLVVPHHGSKTSSSAAFLAMTRPKISLISVGKDNQYGHPSQEVITRLETYGEVYRTDQDGTVKIITDGGTIHVKK